MDEVDLLEAMVAVPSPSGSEAALAQYLMRALGSYGFSAKIDEVGNLIAQVGVGRPRVMFLGHIDTVEGQLPIWRDQRLVAGRGSIDAKGALASAIAAAASLPDISGTLTIIGAVGEESDSRGARHLLRGPSPDCLLVGEPSGWDRVTIGYRGLLRLRYVVEAARSHGSSPEPSAGDLAIRFVNSVQSSTRMTRGEGIRAKVIDISSHRDARTEWCTTNVEVRLPPSIEPHKLAASIPPPDHGSYEVVAAISAVEVDRSNVVVRALGKAIRGEGGRVTHVRKAGTSDMNLAASAWPAPMASYGPGDPRLSHGPEEALPIAELRSSTRVLKTTFKDLLTTS